MQLLLNSEMTSVLVHPYARHPGLDQVFDPPELQDPALLNSVVPRDVAKKYDLQLVNEPIESLIAKKIAENQHDAEEAFYFVDLGIVARKYRQWVKNLPRVKPYYAIKCNNNPAIVKTLGSLGTNFDCASKSEIQQVLGLGFSASQIIYANPTKMISHISYAKSQQVDLMTFDNTHEMEKIAKAFPEARLVLRIITDDSSSVCRFSTKFGCPLDKVTGILELGQKLNLNLVGISFHVGSGCMSTASFVKAITDAHNIFQEAKKYGFHFNILDLGGGWPGTDDGAIRFDDIAASISPLLDQYFPADSGVDLIAEPGRFFVAQSHTLACNVFAKRTMENPDNEKQFLYYINDGVYQSFNCILFDHAHPTPLVFEPRGRTQMFKSTLFGPTCDSMDCIAKDISLPELETGEWLYFKNMGAYTVAAASPFNGFKAYPNTFYIETIDS